METQKICPNCRKPLPPDVPLGLCPECLIKSGFPTGTEPGVTGETAGARFVPPPIEEIARLFPQFEILGFIGKGGMGAVYKARQPALDRFVALKVLPPAVASDPGFAERFSREARALARLNHPNIVAVHDFGKAGALHYLLMEFVDGTNLREVEHAGRLTPEQALAIVPQICEALQFAHNEGIVHRDIKPENLLVDKKGRVKITDFGIAKIVGAPAGKVSLTGARDVVGTPHYMAPEQIEKPQTVDHRADIYSLGVVFYEMLTGELPLGKFQPPSQKVHIDVRLDEVVLHALEKEPARRYQHVSQVKTAVETIATTSPGGGRAPRDESVQAEGGERATGVQLEAVRDHLKIPARGLIAAGVLQVLVALGLLIFAVPIVAHKSGDLAGCAVIGCIAAFSLIPAAVVLLGATNMLQLRRYKLTVVASVVAAVAGPAAILGLPFGVWSLVVLARREVREMFARKPELHPASKRFWPWAVGIALIGMAIVMAMFVINGLITSVALMHHHKTGGTSVAISANAVTLDAPATNSTSNTRIERATNSQPGNISSTAQIEPATHLEKVVGNLSTTDAFHQDFNQTLPLSAQGRFRIDNVNGRIEIFGWDGNEVVIKALKHGKTEESVEAVKIKVDSSPDEIAVHTEQPSSMTGFSGIWSWLMNGGNNSAVVDYAIQVPRHVRLGDISSVNGRVTIDGVRGDIQASTVNGAMQVEGAAGNLRLSTVNGRIAAELVSLGRGQTVSINSDNGKIEVTLPANADAEVSASTVNGGMTSEFPALVVKKEFPLSRNLNGTLGNGGASVKASTVNGRINFRKGKDAQKSGAEPAEAEDPGQTVTGLSPVVVETWPVSGARNVEPGVTEIRVRFSKEMADGGWSWSTAWENSTPETIGQIHYEADHRTCVLKAKLEPGRTYAWWLNSNQFKNFTDLGDRAAVPYLLIFQTKPN